jgi:hypothetical protein
VDIPAPFFAGCGIDVSRFGVPSIARRALLEERSRLRVSVQIPRIVTPSSTVRYTITITNTGDAAYSLRPCPSYQEYMVVIVPGSRAIYTHPSFYLNCQTVRSIPPHGMVTFAMEMQVPAAVGQAKFGWILNVAGSPAAGTVLRVIPASP